MHTRICVYSLYYKAALQQVLKVKNEYKVALNLKNSGSPLNAVRVWHVMVADKWYAGFGGAE